MLDDVPRRSHQSTTELVPLVINLAGVVLLIAIIVLSVLQQELLHLADGSITVVPMVLAFLFLSTPLAFLIYLGVSIRILTRTSVSPAIYALATHGSG